MPPRVQQVRFTGSTGHELAARLDLPAGPAVATAVFAHCFTCVKELRSASQITSELTRHGFAVLRFDFTGLGASDGEFANTTLTSNAADLVAAAAWLRTSMQAPQLLVGHSLGGAAVIVAAEQIPEVRAVATIGAPSDSAHVLSLLGEAVGQIEAEGVAEVCIGGRPFSVGRHFLDDVRSVSLTERVHRMHRALLVLHSPIDNVVGVQHAASLMEAARYSKSFVALDGADHLLSRNADATFAGSMIATWARRHVHDERGFAPLPRASAQAVVAETSQGPYLNHVVLGAHHLLADEPESVGGFDAGPAPYDFLCAALGACTSMTLRMYADRKGLPLARVTVEVDHAKVTPEGGGTPVDRFTRRIHTEGELDDEMRARLVEIAGKCPVHRTLERNAEIVTEVPGA